MSAVPQRPAWKLRAHLSNGALLCGRLPEGYAVRATDAVEEFIRRRPDLAPLRDHLRAYPVSAEMRQERET